MRDSAVHRYRGDSPAWNGKPPEVLQRVVARTPLGGWYYMDEVVGSVLFLLDNQGINSVSLYVDGGWLLTASAPQNENQRVFARGEPG